MNLSLNDSVQYLKGVGPVRSEFFSRKNIHTVRDILYYFPRKYNDYRNLRRIRNVRVSETVTVYGRLESIRESRMRMRRGKRISAVLTDDTSAIQLVWFNSPYIKEALAKAGFGFFSGKVSQYKGLPQMTNPAFEPATEDMDPEDLIQAGGLVPVYPSIEGVSQFMIRKITRGALEKYQEVIPEELDVGIVKEYTDMPVADALWNMHFPKDPRLSDKAMERFVFDEFIVFQAAVQALKEKRIVERGALPVRMSEKIDHRIRKRFPFRLTQAQNRCVEEILTDLDRDIPMHRLLHGDVGSGKTAVAIYAMLAAVAAKGQVALMAPTEILAEQHFISLTGLLADSRVRIGLLTSGIAAEEKERVLAGLKSGDINIAVGTHSIFQRSVEFENLRLAIIDEHHRFGVLQRAQLLGKGVVPHILVMTATPIPRTITITLYGDLDISVIDEMPPGRTPVKTYRFREKGRKRAYSFIRKELDKNNRIYVVCPVIDDSPEHDLKSVTEVCDDLRKNVFPEHCVALLHGRMPQQEKASIMKDFRSGKINILVSTTVIEVGMDIPDATVMMVEHAERFGLSQLHQLRGRVGRSRKPSMMIMLSNAGNEEAEARLKAMTGTNDGFRIAEEDLKIRGCGQYFGTRQHGKADFEIGDPLRDYTTMVAARNIVKKRFTKDPTLRSCPKLRAAVSKRYGKKFKLGEIA